MTQGQTWTWSYCTTQASTAPASTPSTTPSSSRASVTPSSTPSSNPSSSHPSVPASSIPSSSPSSSHPSSAPSSVPSSITPAPSSTRVSSSPTSSTSTTSALDCFNLPPFPDFCTYDECFAAKEQCLGYYRTCLQLYPNQNTQWYVSSSRESNSKGITTAITFVSRVKINTAMS